MLIPGNYASRRMLITDKNTGTTEIVYLILGRTDCVKKIRYFIMEKIKEQPDTNAKMVIDLDKKQHAEGEKEVKILVANLTDGKDDSYIKQVEETSGNDVQISQNSKDGALADDCIAVNDETENGKAASSLIISNIVEDPQSGSSLNVNYADFTGPVENLNPTDSPFANPGDVCYGAANNSNNFSSLNNFVPTVANSFPWFQVSSTDPRFVSSLSSSDSLLAIENVKNTLYNHGYTEEAISEISGAMNTLAKYRMLGIYNDIMVNNSNPHLGSALVVAIPVPAASSYLMTPGEINEGIYTPTSILSNMGAAYDSVATSTPLGIGSSVFVPIGSLCNQMSSLGIGPNFISPNTSRSSDHFLVEGEANAPEQFHSASSIIDSQSAAALPVNENSFGFGSGLSSRPANLGRSPVFDNQVKEKIQFEVPEDNVGAIIGYGGNIIKEIQRSTGTFIYISNKIRYIPGSRNRIVTIIGLPPAVSTARYLIERRLSGKD